MSAHAEFLRAASNDSQLAAQLKDDYRKANLPAQDRRMLEFVEKFTLYPWLLVRTDVALLQRAGFADSETLYIVLGSAHFNYLNRMADGIGIQFEYQTEVPAFTVPSAAKSSLAVATVLAALPKDGPGWAWIVSPESSEFIPGADEPQNLYRVMSYNPPARELAREWRNYQLKGTTALDARRRARLALYISGLNRCDYSAYWLRKSLRNLGETEITCDRLASGSMPENLSPLENLLFAHAQRLTREPWTTKEEHIQQLRQAGLDDRGILQLTMLCSYLSFENRVALGLGLKLEND
ncbi:MAG: hypothetical protein L0387_41905 [Acidobacteria bacterium]|nr:hypothetical protein [Acidobacteriota bacterium]MCI0721580.1 hypothetical protein [Acidobacteriota bacterium]